MSPEEKAKADEIYKAIIGKERNTLVKRYGKDAEKVAKGRAIKQAQKLAEKKMESSKDRLKEMVKTALMGTNEELKGGQKKLDVNKDGKISGEDFAMLRKGKMEEAIDQAIVLTDKDHENLMKNGSVAVNVGGQTVVVALKDFQVDMEDVEDYNLEEDLDLGHEDNEPHMIKGELYRIGKYAMELYQMVDEFEYGYGEVDFPAWWQAKITTAKNMVSSAKHYLEFELKEPEIDAMVGAIDMSGALDNVGVEEPSLAERIAKRVKEDIVKGSNIRKDSKGKWRVLSGKTGKMWPQTYDSKADAEDALQAYHATKG
jgi:hypothetical protein